MGAARVKVGELLLHAARIAAAGSAVLLNAARCRTEAWAWAPRRERAAQLAEYTAALGLTALALLTRSVAAAAWVVANVAMAMTAAAWASHLPHRPPAWLRLLAAGL